MKNTLIENMITGAFGILALMFAANTTFAQSGEHSPEAVADSFYTAIAGGDETEVRSLLDPSVLIFESGNVESSLDEYASHHMHSDMKFMANMTRETVNRQVMEEGSLAVVTTQSKISGRYDDRPLRLNSTETLVMEKGENGWQIRHIHWSSKEMK